MKILLPPLVYISAELANHSGHLVWLNNNPIMNKTCSTLACRQGTGNRSRVPLGAAAAGKGSHVAYVRGTLV